MNSCLNSNNCKPKKKKTLFLFVPVVLALTFSINMKLDYENTINEEDPNIGQPGSIRERSRLFASFQKGSQRKTNLDRRHQCHHPRAEVFPV
mmetsp:Transcript_1777/g.2230  ORF Transcript_1777/g.2230 Transcript_1777/m.2230 type:complete len:92 (-) Transcript_1777:52-327(-)